MKYIFFLYRIVIITVLIIYSIEKLYANSSTAGNTVTVNRDSGFNALRSPSLMNWQDSDRLGLGFVYRMQLYDDFEGSISMFGVSAPVDSETDTVFKGAFLLSGTVVFNKHSLGFGIKNIDESQFAITKSHTDINSAGTSIDEKNSVIDLSTVYSYAYRFSSRQSAGLQVETGFFRKKTDEDVNDGVNYRYRTITAEGFSGSISFGYSFIGRKIEAGLMATTGVFSRTKTDVSYEKNSPAYVKSKTGTDPEIFQNRGYGLLAGIGLRPHYKLLLIFETGLEIPYEYDHKSINDDFVEVTNNVDSSGVYLARLGADCSVNRNTSAGIGFTWAHADKAIDASDGKKSEIGYSLYELNTGIEYKLFNGLSILMACSISYIAAEMSITNPGPPVNTLELKPDTLNLSLATGVSINF